jgi:predicted membrane channel-forming protein YqfA (hemolysin III family)
MHAQMPEAVIRGVFDLFGNSHQIWHVLYITAMFVLFHDSLDLFGCQHNRLLTDAAATA